MGILSEPVLVFALVAWIGGFGLVAARMARNLDRIPAAWFVIGAIFGPAALLVLRQAPPGRCRTCGTPTRGWGYTCWWCREDVRMSNASLVAMEARMSRPSADARPRTLAAPPPVNARPLAPAAPPRESVPTRRSAVDAGGTHAPEPRQERAEPRQERAEPRPVPDMSSQTPVARLAARTSSLGRPPLEPPKPVENLSTSANRSTDRAPGVEAQPLASAVFVVGSARLEPGRRYGLAIRSNRLLILGPIDIDPSAVALDRPLAEIDVHAVDGRLVVSEPRSGSGLALAFMAVTGATTEGVAALITDAAQQASRPT